MTKDIITYLASGCGRCDLFDTPQCKTVTWTAEILTLRQIMLSTELTEEMKWGSPVYTLNGKNVIMLAAFEALTPGRQRGYNLFFTGAKQSKTRYARIEKCMPAIMEGKGLHDR